MEDKPRIEEVAEVVAEGKLFEEIGCGGYKVVYKGEVSDKVEAIKIVRIPDDDEAVWDENLRRITREIGILAQSISPYLVRLGSVSPREVRIADNMYVLYSEEYIAGDTLRKLIVDGYKPTRKDLAELGICLLKAVRELAAMDVIHRDIKPENIIKTHNPKRPFVLLDLGIAFHLRRTQITRDSMRIPGTLYYIAPEMLDQGFRQNLDYRADLYTIGLTLYEFASGNNPFAHSSDPQFTTLYRIKTLKPEPLRRIREDLPKELCNLIDQLMKKLPALRPANVESLIKQMEASQ